MKIKSSPLFIGVSGEGYNEFPVFYDPHHPILTNKAPITQVTGSPGSGKTFFGLILASHASILKKIGFILDPKGDFTALKKLAKAKMIEDVYIWDVVPEGGKIIEEDVGVLDPTTFYEDRNENVALTVDIISALCGGLTSSQHTYLTPVVRDIVESERPTFEKVYNKILRERDDEIRTLGYTLQTAISIPIAKLLSADSKIPKRKLQVTDRLIVTNLLGLTLPTPEKEKNEYSTKEKVSTVIMRLLSMLVLDLMKKGDDRIPKLLMIDEAWVLFSTPDGKNMINEVGRLGRSKNMAMILLTQSPKHLNLQSDKSDTQEGDLNSLISVRFAFMNNDSQSNAITCKTMKFPEEDGADWGVIIQDLEVGRCLMQDSEYNKAIVHIMTDDRWIPIFDTNPLTKKQKEKDIEN